MDMPVYRTQEPECSGKLQQPHVGRGDGQCARWTLRPSERTLWAASRDLVVRTYTVAEYALFTWRKAIVLHDLCQESKACNHGPGPR